MRSDNRFLTSATRIPLGSHATDRSGEPRVLYEMGEYVPGKDEYLELCEACPFEECIRIEGDFSPYRTPAQGTRDYPGCPVWEQGKLDFEEKMKSGKPKAGWRGASQVESRGNGNGNGRTTDSP